LDDRDRYAGKPFLRLLDAFMLWSIGALDDATNAKLEAMTPKLQQAFGMKNGTWQVVVMKQMDFDEDYVEWLREKWGGQLEHDRTIGQEHDPRAWAQAMSDFIGSDEMPSLS
jgi:hypothetical protein